MRTACLALVAAAACASPGGSAAPSARPATEDIRIQGVGTLHTSASTPGSAKSLPFAFERVWKALPAVYDSLGIPVTSYDAGRATIANGGLKIRARLGRIALSKYLDCGNTQMGPSADNYEVFMTVATHVAPADGGATLVESTVEATARPIQFAQSASRCATKSTLESRIYAYLTAVLANQP